jgi:hypothetical protein
VPSPSPSPQKGRGFRCFGPSTALPHSAGQRSGAGEPAINRAKGDRGARKMERPTNPAISIASLMPWPRDQHRHVHRTPGPSCMAVPVRAPRRAALHRPPIRIEAMRMGTLPGDAQGSHPAFLPDGRVCECPWSRVTGRGRPVKTATGSASGKRQLGPAVRPALGGSRDKPGAAEISPGPTARPQRLHLSPQCRFTPPLGTHLH